MSCIKKTCKKAIKYLLEKLYFEIYCKNIQTHHIIDISMESPSVPFMLKFFFYTAANILLVVKFENILQEIYTLDFKLKKKNTSTFEVCI